MPTYEYRCDGCQHLFEEFQSFSDKPLKKCPQCGKRKLQRLLGTGAAIIFKGSGFYQTDYRSESYKQSAKAEESQATPPAAKTDAPAASGTAKKEDTAGTSGNSGKGGEKTGAKKAKSEG